MIKTLQRRFALSRQGAVDLIKGCIACVAQDISFMIPVGLLYTFVMDMMNGGVNGSRIVFYGAGVLACLCLIFIAAYFQYNATYLATYVESGVRRISLAEQLRKIPLSFFGKKDLADLTNSIMSDCATLETAFSHYVPALAGSLISTTLISVCLFAYDWRMALAAVWVLPVAFVITFFSARIQEYFNRKSVAANVALESGVQECIECLQDLKANNAEDTYLKGLDQKIDYAEKRHIITELGTALFVVSSTLILKFGIATVALAGSVLLVRGEIEIPLFFLFLLAASRLYAPLEGALQNLAAVISTKTNIDKPAADEQRVRYCFRPCGVCLSYRGNRIERRVFYGKAGGSDCFGGTVRRRENNRFPPCRAFLGHRQGENYRWRNGCFTNRAGKLVVPVLHRIPRRHAV